MFLNNHPMRPKAAVKGFTEHSNATIDAGKIRRLELLSVLRTLLAILVALSLGLAERTLNSDTALIAAVYAVSAIVSWRVLSIKPWFWRGVLFAQLMLDLVLISLLVLGLGGSDSGYVVLYVMPIVTAATLLKRPLALFVGAISIIVVLLDALRRQALLQQRIDWLILGLYGIGGFVAILILRLAAERTDNNETFARQAQISAALMQELQEQHLPEDVPAWLVFDQRGVVHLLNNMARSLAWQAGVLLEVGYRITPQSPLKLWLQAGNTQAEQSLEWPPQSAKQLKTNDDITSQTLYVKSSPLPQQHMTALTLELSIARNNKQQQVQLAAMGQISASIAHEIRNPLGAISQAAELIKEGGQLSAADSPLLEMVLLNTQRIERIVNNLLTWSRGMQAHPSEFFPNTQIASVVQQLVIDLAIAPKQLVFQGLDLSGDTLAQYAQHRARFDTDHLYQILGNLLSNALRYAKKEPSSIMVALRPRGNHLAICVMDNGKPVDAGIAKHLFEPFQSTSKQGTGLGLYLSREYAVANQGALQLLTGYKLNQLLIWRSSADLHPWTTMIMESTNTNINTSTDNPSMLKQTHAFQPHNLNNTHTADPWQNPTYTKAFVLSIPWFEKA